VVLALVYIHFMVTPRPERNHGILRRSFTSGSSQVKRALVKTGSPYNQHDQKPKSFGDVGFYVFTQIFKTPKNNNKNLGCS
jgi:hypothetical protein